MRPKRSAYRCPPRFHLTPAHLPGKITAMNTRIFSALIALVAITSVVSITFAQSPAPQPGAPSTTVHHAGCLGARDNRGLAGPGGDDEANDGDGKAQRKSQGPRRPRRFLELYRKNDGSGRAPVYVRRQPYTQTGDEWSFLRGRVYRNHENAGADGKMKDFTFKGMSLEGYDNVKQKFVSSWVDNMGTGIMNSEGSYDPATKTFTYSGEVEPVPGMKMPVREVIKVTDKNHHTFEWYENRGGQETKTLEINYTRKK
jgi:hypothetical protein